MGGAGGLIERLNLRLALWKPNSLKVSTTLEYLSQGLEDQFVAELRVLSDI